LTGWLPARIVPASLISTLQPWFAAMRTTCGVNYDAIAHLYDSQPYREKTVDPELVAFTTRRASSDRLSILDIAGGTGSQLVANRPIVPHARLVGLDRSLGMLRQAQPKARDIVWVQADGAMLPFRPESSISLPVNLGSIICPIRKVCSTPYSRSFDMMDAL
jgi:methyltransferase family protein